MDFQGVIVLYFTVFNIQNYEVHLPVKYQTVCFKNFDLWKSKTANR